MRDLPDRVRARPRDRVRAQDRTRSSARAACGAGPPPTAGAPAADRVLSRFFAGGGSAGPRLVGRVANGTGSVRDPEGRGEWCVVAGGAPGADGSPATARRAILLAGSSPQPPSPLGRRPGRWGGHGRARSAASDRPGRRPADPCAIAAGEPLSGILGCRGDQLVGPLEPAQAPDLLRFRHRDRTTDPELLEQAAEPPFLTAGLVRCHPLVGRPEAKGRVAIAFARSPFVAGRRSSGIFAARQRCTRSDVQGLRQVRPPVHRRSSTTRGTGGEHTGPRAVAAS